MQRTATSKKLISVKKKHVRSYTQTSQKIKTSVFSTEQPQNLEIQLFDNLLNSDRSTNEKSIENDRLKTTIQVLTQKLNA